MIDKRTAFNVNKLDDTQSYPFKQEGKLFQKKNNIYIISQNTKEQGIYIYIYNHKIPKNKEIL